MSVQFYPLAGALKNATDRRTGYANSVIRLFKSTMNPTPSSQLAAYVAAEADYDGYAAVTMAQWNAPILAPGTGYMIGSPLVQFAWTLATNAVGNMIGGAFVVDSAGVLRMVVVFTQPIPMQGPGAGLPINLIDFFPTGA